MTVAASFARNNLSLIMLKLKILQDVIK